MWWQRPSPPGSGGLEPVLDSGGGNHSVFASAFLDALADNSGLLEGSSFFTQVRSAADLVVDSLADRSLESVVSSIR